jgi:hypothetical protein
MTTNPESQPSGESKNRQVFEIFDRASSSVVNKISNYLIGDGIFVRVGWVDNEKVNPDLTVVLIDAKVHTDAGLIVGPETARYERDGGALPASDWIAADIETRRRARKFYRRESFSISTASLAPVAQAVSQHDPHSEPGPIPSATIYETALDVEPLPTTDIPFIRQLIVEWSRSLDEGFQQ